MKTVQLWWEGMRKSFIFVFVLFGVMFFEWLIWARIQKGHLLLLFILFLFGLFLVWAVFPSDPIGHFFKSSIVKRTFGSLVLFFVSHAENFLTEKFGKIEDFYEKFEDEDEDGFMTEVLQKYHHYSGDESATKFIKPKAKYFGLIWSSKSIPQTKSQLIFLLLNSFCPYSEIE